MSLKAHTYWHLETAEAGTMLVCAEAAASIQLVERSYGRKQFLNPSPRPPPSL